MIVRTVGPGGQPVPGPSPPQGQRVAMSTQGQQIIRTGQIQPHPPPSHLTVTAVTDLT